MKSLTTLIRIIIVGLCWSLFFFEGIRVILLTNWHFDLIDPRHWKYVWNLWMSGWVIDDSREWAFVLIILSFIPLWLTGWASLSLIKWEHLLAGLLVKLTSMYNKFIQKNTAQPAPTPTVLARPAIKRKKSYKEIRPRSLSTPLSGQTEHQPLATPSPLQTASRPLPTMNESRPAPLHPSIAPAPNNSILDHSLFKLDNEEDDFDLNFDDLDKIGSEPKPQPQKTEAKSQSATPQEPRRNNRKDNTGNDRGNRQKDNNKDANPAPRDNNRKNNKPLPITNQPQTPKNSGNSSLEIIKQKGYQVITSATIKNNFVDFIGVADGQICICLVDKEAGDWLADEERFNDEEPLWFSENSHRISPVRCADIVQNYLTEKLKENGIDYAISTYVIVQYGNIINAEDMFETWQNMHINVTRIDRGMPRELRLFAKALEDADKSIDIERFEKIKKIVRNLT